ncbi:MAG: hypothetical protein MRK00_15745 [Nitrosomonas sp.]|nr:hypothetical protein [Nitrosomonas sp.]
MPSNNLRNLQTLSHGKPEADCVRPEHENSKQPISMSGLPHSQESTWVLHQYVGFEPTRYR